MQLVDIRNIVVKYDIFTYLHIQNLLNVDHLGVLTFNNLIMTTFRNIIWTEIGGSAFIIKKGF